MSENKNITESFSQYGYRLIVNGNRITIIKPKLPAFYPFLLFISFILAGFLGLNSEEGSGKIVWFEDFWTGIIDVLILFGLFMFGISFLSAFINSFKTFSFKIVIEDEYLWYNRFFIPQKFLLTDIIKLKTTTNHDGDEYTHKLIMETRDNRKIKLITLGPSRIDKTEKINSWKEYLEKVIKNDL